MGFAPRSVLARIGSLSKEAARRKVWISAGAYLALSIGVIEISQAVASALLFPDWTSRLVTFLLILGFPLVVVLAWVFDIGEGGLRRTDAPDTDLLREGKPPGRPFGGNARGPSPAPVSRSTLRVPPARPPSPAARALPIALPDPDAPPPDAARVQRAALGHVRHELRTPINAILGYSEMLLEDDAPAEAKADLQRIHEGGKRLLSLVDSILDARRIESDGTRDLESYAAQIEADLRTPVSSVVGYCEILVEAETEAGRTAMVADLERILNAARALLETSSDIVRVAEQADEAARVTDSSALATDVLAKLRPVASAGATEGEGTLLVVDDNETNRNLLTRQLARHGYVVATARDGQEALERMRRQAFDLVLLDVIMPNVDGVEALRRIKADEQLRDTAVIMLSSLDEVDSAVRCLELGAEEYLSKPIEGALLEARIRANLEVRHLRTRERALSARLEADEALVDGLLTHGLPASMADRVRSGDDTIVDAWPAAAVVCLVPDPLPFGAASVDRYVTFLADALEHFETAATSVEGLDARVAGRPGFVAVSLAGTGERSLASPAAELAVSFLGSLAESDPDAAALFRGGIHSGGVVASVFRFPRPRFEIWGEAVDTARLVAELAEPGTVLVTPPAKSQLGDEFALDALGVREVGERGSMRLHRLVLS
jgi:CheY-like chemotaxis protein